LDLYGLQRIGEKRGGEWAYALGDALGSLRQWVDDGAHVSYAAGYTPFGEMLWEQGRTESSWNFTGEWYDANAELVYLRARWYEPGMGSFLSEDPWKGNDEQPLTLNAYLYVLANPMRYVDPTGLFPRDILPEDVLNGVCQEKDCQFHPVIWYIVNRIREDSMSRQIRTIRELNTSSYLNEDARVLCDRLPLWQRLLICPDYVPSYGADREAYIMFGCLVADSRLRPVCGQWDYKKEIEILFDNSQTIDFCSIGHDEEVKFYYDIWANIHFGYLGMTGGFPEDLLLLGATVEHRVANLGQSEDDRSDQVSIRIGMRLYREALTERALVRRLYEHRHELNKARLSELGDFEVYR
jgi:RHS repeat-associated protein